MSRREVDEQISGDPVPAAVRAFDVERHREIIEMIVVPVAHRVPAVFAVFVAAKTRRPLRDVALDARVLEAAWLIGGDGGPAEQERRVYDRDNSHTLRTVTWLFMEVNR